MTNGEKKKMRGRPPLIKKISKEKDSSKQPKASKKKSKNRLMSAKQAKYSSAGHSLSIHSGSNAVQYNNYTNVDGEVMKEINKLQPHLVTQKVMNHLMTNEPASLHDLMKNIDAARETIQSNLDILQVLGIVIQIKAKKLSTSPLYTLVNFARCSEPCNLREMRNEISSKKEHIISLRKRIKHLQVTSFL
jgi:hypothetical protein